MSADRSTPSTEQFERAFVAIRALLGRKDEPLDAPLPGTSPATRRLVDGLSHPDRAVRAPRLAAELGRVVQSLEARRLG